jgi:hypothetical protein
MSVTNLLVFLNVTLVCICPLLSVRVAKSGKVAEIRVMEVTMMVDIDLSDSSSCPYCLEGCMMGR